jgi:hypothetical protein
MECNVYATQYWLTQPMAPILFHKQARWLLQEHT